MKTKLLVLFLLAGSAAFAAHFSIGVGIGVPAYPYYGPAYPYYNSGYYVPAPVPRYPVQTYVPVAPGPDYYWVQGYYYRVGPRSVYRAGYWARRPYNRSGYRRRR